ncbi:MAG: thermonuclease family protein [Firmicutes bacterium]|nr:thermonuclease family protein [Bacillota bacterium]
MDRPGQRPARRLPLGLLVLVGAAALAIRLLWPGPPGAPPERPGRTFEAAVVRVIDGDTAVVRTGGREETVRYIGIDAPELERDRREGPGWAAREANRQMIDGARVRLELDAEARDQYGRLLAYVYAGDVFVNERLVREGMAVAFVAPPNDRRAQSILEGQRAAVVEGRGLWGQAAARIVAADRAGSYIGLPATVEGVVHRAHFDPESGIAFLNFGPDPRRDFVVIIRRPFRPLFPEPPELRYAGRRVRVKGLVERFQRQPQISVQVPEQIEVMD